MKLENSIYDIRLQMWRIGGEFVRALSVAMGKADLEKQAKLVEAFPEIFERYDALATLAKKGEPNLKGLDDEN